jgi:hypothetical protein
LDSCSVKRTRSGDSASMRETICASPRLCGYTKVAGKARLNGCCGSVSRRQVKSTSSALNSRVGVKNGVVWKRTPGRSSKVNTRASGDTCQAVASAGTRRELPRS